MIAVIWSLCLIFCLSNTILVIAKDLCLPDQRDALWEFKNEFYVQEFDPSANGGTDIEKWRNNTDCCSWDGVSCDPKTGVVVELDLEFNGLNGPLRSNSSLFRLQHLQKLYLGCNTYNDDLKGGELPDSIGNLKYLRFLSFQDCNLYGKIPSSLGNLSYLTHLDLSFNDDLTGEILDSMGNLKHLRVLSLISCKFSGMMPSSLGNLSYLTDLDLSYNDFTGVIPDSMGNLNYLRVLRLGKCNFYGKVPSSLGNLSYLAQLDLSYNGFTSEGPDSMGNLNRLTDMLLNLSSLTYIDLGSNQLKGMLPSNMSSLSKLKYFDIGGNSFSGTIPSSLFMIPSLIVLHLRRNDFSGPFEIGNISSPSNLQLLYIGENNFNPDIVDLSIFSPLLSLGYLDVSGINLKISSTVSLPSPIEYLVLSSCNISEFPKFLRNQTKLYSLDISANQIEGQVPEWLWSLPELGLLNISQNSFNGFEGPADVIQRRGELIMLDISSNTFQDPFPLLPVVSMTYLFSSNNRFSGEIPKTICELDNLWILVLSNNNFSGSIPRCFGNLTLWVLHLRNNSLSGIFLEESISHLLQSLDVGLNRLSGELPKSLINCTRLEFLNVEDNMIHDKFPFWLRSLPNLQILVLRSNEFYGPIFSPGDSLSFPKLRIFDNSENRFTGVLPSDYFVGWSAMLSVVSIYDSTRGYAVLGAIREAYHKSVVLTNKGLNMELVGSGFTIYKTIDVSGNRLQGDIPESIGILKELIVLNMSNNAFTGHIPPSLSNLSNLQSLDLSQNRLSGSIPGELGKLTFIARMNFSYNMLEGPIPQTTQIQTQDSSSFTENPGLCGAPLLKKCGGEEEATKQEQDEEKEEEEQVLSWIAAAIGYVPGVVCGLTIGHILVSHKRDWFMRIVSLFT
ncbi:Receptor-like protein 47 [Arabidopsis thaliana]|uniref:Receptor like protein n=1 Tax=Arabidopsis thaliana TaxID=3702 RepID=A0A178UUB4_ARATH|nr:hypothetical protein AXX17_AT4G15760 [Arabidopsis thaliana]